MSPKKRRVVCRRGSNREGHFYTKYSDGAFSYRNVDRKTGKTISSYYNNGHGHVFYWNYQTKSGFHHNLKTNVQTDLPKKDKKMKEED